MQKNKFRPSGPTRGSTGIFTCCPSTAPFGTQCFRLMINSCRTSIASNPARSDVPYRTTLVCQQPTPACQLSYPHQATTLMSSFPVDGSFSPRSMKKEEIRSEELEAKLHTCWGISQRIGLALRQCLLGWLNTLLFSHLRTE